MAEALAVLGAVSSGLQIIDFTSKLIAHAQYLSSANNDALRENIDIERLARQYESLTEAAAELERTIPDPRNRTKEQQDVVETAGLCRREAKGLLSKLQDLRVNAVAGRWARIKEGTKQAARFLQARKDIEKRRRLLHELNGQLTAAMLRAQDTQYTTILDHLRFPDMQLRGTTIRETYPNTYRWAVNDDSLKLKPWLQTGGGIFWVTGKPGAGKSTLMKYISTAQETGVLLRKWAGKSELVAASFYFWYLGSEVQKSIKGLLRSILYQLIKAQPFLACQVCPEYFDGNASDHEDIWTLERLSRGVKDFVALASKDHDGHPGKVFCFFIDGLDEYNGNHLDLITILQSFTESTSVKLCLSSRPWTSFRIAFEHRCPHLHLEDITRIDIQTYVHGHIRGTFGGYQKLIDPDDDALVVLDDVDALVDEIVTKAEGVFLWVFLVVAYVERGLAEQDPLEKLRQRVEHFPPDLNQFLQELIFDRVDPVYVQQTCQALQLASRYVEERNIGYLPSWMDYWFILCSDRGIDDVEHLQQVTMSQPVFKYKKLAARTRTLLSATCKDLLLMRRPGDKSADEISLSPNVEFLHRTVYEFLCTTKIRQQMIANTPSAFRSNRIVHLLNQAKFMMMARADFQAQCPGIDRDTVQMSATFSLTTSHIDLNAEYAASFEPALLVPRRYPNGHHMTGVIASLIAAKKYTFVYKWFPSQHQLYTETEGKCTWMEAAMGHLPTIPFGPQHIDVDFLQQMRTYFPRTWENACLAAIEQGFSMYFVDSLLGRFIREWAIEASQKQPNYGSEYLPAAWEVTRLFLGRTTRWLDFEFPWKPKSSRLHEHPNVRSWLLQEIPDEWMQDLGEEEKLALMT